jgi:hypothetical protein
MRCENHPEFEAVAQCPSCGKHICEFCRVIMFNMPHCKECTQNMVQSMQILSPRKLRKLAKKRRLKAMERAEPKGKPNRDFFIIGGVGSIIISIATFAIGWSFSVPRHVGFGSYPLWLVQYIVLFAVGMAITVFGFYGLYRNYGTAWGIVASTFCAIGSFWIPLLVYTSIHMPRGWGDDAVRYSLKIQFGFALLIIGTCLVFMGIALINVKNITRERVLTFTSGLLNIVVAVLFFIIFPASTMGIAWFGFSSSSIIMAFVFISAKLDTAGPPELSEVDQIPIQ